MTLDEFTKWRLNFTKYPRDGKLKGLPYCALKLNGESGEFAEKLGKIMRDKDSEITGDDRYLLLLELGDVLWYVDALAVELGSTLQEVADLNIEKLESRKARGVLGGSGDKR